LLASFYAGGAGENLKVFFVAEKIADADDGFDLLWAEA
jgi:hypothetical protein